jgi:ELWxxDGT repeat protein
MTLSKIYNNNLKTKKIMKTKIYAISILLSLGSVFVHAEEVLPAGMTALTGTDVQVTSVDNMNRTKAEKPIVKTQNNNVFFTATTNANGEEIWVTDGTVPGTKMIKDINAGALSANPKWLTAVGNTVYFVATTATNGEELWMTDGTEAGTKMVKDIYAGSIGSAPFGLTAFNSNVLFFAMDEESEFTPVIDPSKPEKWLWISDGTLAGTKRIANTPTKETNYDGQEGNLVKCGNICFFVGYDLTNNESLWTTDGTNTGTKVVKNINPRAATGTFATASGAIDWLTNINNKKVAFRAETVSEVTGGVDVGSEIWLSDGTAAGTNWIGIDFAKGQVNGLPRGTQFAVTMAYNDTMFFRADDGVHGVEPCVLDISKPILENSNPRQFFDINHWGKNPSYHSWPSQFAKYKGDVYIQANGGYFLPNSATPTQEYASNYSLWRSPLNKLDTCIYQKQIWDMEIFPGNFADGCTWFKEVNGRLFFSAQNAANNKELWVIDNPTTAPKLVMDLPSNGLPCQLTNVNENLFFASAGTKVLYKYIAAITSLKDNKLSKSKLKIYPNPASEILNISSNNEISDIAIVDLMGKQIKSQSFVSNININGLAKGTYILKVKFIDGSVEHEKFSVK